MRWLLLLLLALGPTVNAAPDLKAWPRSEEYRRSGPVQVDYMLGLGAMQKVHGFWRNKDSETISGRLERITWKVDDGYTAEEGFAWLKAQVPDAATLMFECEGRRCGSSAQWASRVFEERVLYGHDERQHYAVWRYRDEDGVWSIVLYASDRANRRHFLHLDLLQHDPA